MWMQKRMPKTPIIYALPLLFCALGTAWSDDSKTAYPSMAPIAQYRMASTAEEIALARSAAPTSISGEASIQVLGDHGYETAAKGTNGFVCMVSRLWTAGFDMIYACQDYAFDVHSGLHSVPQKFGIAGALWIARAMHVGMLICLIALVHAFALGPLALAGIAAVAGLLIWEHRLVKADDLSRIDAAFFTMNGYVSVIFFLFWAADILIHK